MSRRGTMLLGWDAFGTIVVTCVLIAVVPDYVPVGVAKEVYSLSASVLSIVFSVFTAALAIIISSPDDKFVQFLQTEGLFEDILWGFRITLCALFIALVYSIFAFCWTAFQVTNIPISQHRSGIVAGLVMLTYSLGATLSSIFASIRHARARADFLRTLQD